MKGQPFLRAGTPDDDNREYLPEKLKGTDIVVNENGNNSLPYPTRLTECRACLDENGDITEDAQQGISGLWYEYVPETFDPDKKTPLVLSMHGGLMTGWGQSVYSSWSLLAEREGFLCAFPNGHTNRFWQLQVFGDRKVKPGPLNGMAFPEPAPTVEENTDLNFTLRLIKHLEKKYPNVDKGRIFMQGMSNGCGMTHQFARYYGNLLAGAACSAGPVNINCFIDENSRLINAGGPTAMWEAHPENNRMGDGAMEAEARKTRESRYYWLAVNGCVPVPKIQITGEDNFAFFEGGKAPYVFLDIKNRDHGQTLDEAFLYWDYLFAGTRREDDGTCTQGRTPLSRQGDANAAAFVPGVAKAWWHNRVVPMTTAPVRWQKLKYHGLDGGTMVRGEYTCVPLSFLAQMTGAQLAVSEDTLTAKIMLPDGRKLQFARGSIGCLIDDRLRSMFCEALHRNGELLISAEWFATCILNWTATVCNGVTYVTDHFAQLSYFMAELIKDIVNDRVFPENYIEEALKD